MTGEAELGVGIAVYATSGLPCPCRAKVKPEDFVVEESVSLAGLVATGLPGYYPLYRVQKQRVDTMHMARELSGALKSRVSYGGLKDKRATATQYVTPTSVRSGAPTEVHGEGFVARLVGFVPRPLSRRSVEGNRFRVTLRECCPGVEARISEAMRSGLERKIPNYYGLQRFGVAGPGTHLIGKALIRGEFREAVELMLFWGGKSEGQASASAREEFLAARYEEGARLLPPGRDVEKVVARELGRHPGEWVRALRALPVRLRRLYVHAYQSLIFNKALTSAAKAGEDISSYRRGDNWAEVSDGGLVTSEVRGVRDLAAAGAIPMVQLVGYAYRDYGSRFDAHIAGVLESEEVVPARFFVKGMEEVSSEGGFRRPHIALEGPSWRVAGDLADLSFTLGRGQYATILLREIIKPEDASKAGLA